MNQMKTITIRVSPEEHQVIVEKARCANLSLNRFVVEAATKSAPRTDQQLTNLMGQLCKLELLTQQATSMNALRSDIHDWRFATMQMMEG